MHAEYVVLDVCEHCINPEELRPARRFPAAARFDRQMHDLTGRRKRGEASAAKQARRSKRGEASAAKQESPSETTAVPGKIARIRNFFTIRLPEALQTLQQRALRATLVVGLDGGDKGGLEIGVRVEFPTEGLAGASHHLPRAGCRQTQQYAPIKSTLTPIACSFDHLVGLRE
jgi:hypothetical protein